MIKVDVYTGIFGSKNVHPASALIATFKEYKLNNKFWSFGRDEPYRDPPSVIACGLKHIHIITHKEYIKAEKAKSRLYDRTSNKHLVYAVSPYDTNHYLLIAILDPEAHKQARDMGFMRDLVEICNNHFG